MFTDFYEKTTKGFDVTPTINGVEQSITGTTLEFIMKVKMGDLDSQAVVFKESTNGHFYLSPEDTAITPRTYFYEIKWVIGSDEYILESGTVNVIRRVFD